MAQVQKEILGGKRQTAKNTVRNPASYISRDSGRRKEAELQQKRDELNDTKQLNLAKRRQKETSNALITDMGTTALKQTAMTGLIPYMNLKLKGQESELNRLSGDYKAASTPADADRIYAAYEKKYGEYEKTFKAGQKVLGNTANSLQSSYEKLNNTYLEAHEADEAYIRMLHSYQGKARGLSSDVRADLKKRDEARLQAVDRRIQEIDRLVPQKEQERDRVAPQLQYMAGANAGFEVLDRYNAEIQGLRNEQQECRDYLDFQKKYGSLEYEDDFEEYSRKGAEIENPSYHEASALFGPKVKNPVTFGRENAMEIFTAEGHDPYAKYAYAKYMTDDELRRYNYLLTKRDGETADEYFDALYDELVARKGKQIAESIKNVENPVLKKSLYATTALNAGAVDSIRGIQQFFSSDKLPTLESEITNQELSKDLDGWEKIAYQALYTVGQQAPQMLVGHFAGSVGGALGATANAAKGLASTAGAATVFMSAGGNAYKEALQQGYSKEQARTYSVLTGASEAVLEKLLGGLHGVTGTGTEKLLNKISGIDNALARVALKFGVESLGEIEEEELQNFLDPLFREIVFGEEYQAPTAQELVETALVTFFSTNISNAPGNAADTASAVQQTLNDRAGYRDAVRNGKDFYALNQLSGGELARQNGYMDIEQAYNDPAKAYELAWALQQNPSRGKAGNLLENQGKTQSKGQTQYSLKTFPDGKRFVDVDTDQAKFDGLDEKAAAKLARSIIKEQFKGKVIGIENRVFVNGNTAEEYTQIKPKMEENAKNAKFRASTELDNLLDAGTNFRTEPDGRDGHFHAGSTGDFRYFDTIFKVEGEYYQGTINIQQVAKGLLLKDVTQIKNITQDIHASYGENPQSIFLRDASINSIPTSKENVNGKSNLSLQDLDPAELTRILQQKGLSQGMIENLLGSQGETAPKSQEKTQYSIETTLGGKKYVKADRQVISGNDPKQWAGQITNYINQQIRNGHDITLTTNDGDLLQITRDTAGKAQFRNLVKQANGSYLPMSDSQYAAKLRAEGHIDELAEISTRGKKTVPDKGGKHGKFAANGWNYRTAYFEDVDGQYYRLKISTAKNGNFATVYNVNLMVNSKKPYSINGTSASKNGALLGSKTRVDRNIASNISISAASEKVNGKSYLSLAGLDPIAAGEIQRQMAGVKTDFEKSVIRWGVSPEKANAVSGLRGNVEVVFDGTLRDNENGYYQDGVIHLNPNLSSEQAILTTYGHELTHALENTGSYRELANLVLNGIGNKTAIQNAVNEKIELYRKNGVELDRAGAVYELVADFAAERLFTDEQTVRRLVREKPGLAKRILSWIREQLAKLTNDTAKAELLRAERLYSRMINEALETSEKQMGRLQEQGNNGTMEEAKNSLKEDTENAGEKRRGGEPGAEAYRGGQEGSGSSDAGRRATDQGVRRELSTAAGRYGGIDPSFGATPYRAWAEGHIVKPAAESVAYGEQQMAVEYGVSSFVISEDAWVRNKGKTAAFAFDGQIYFREKLPESKRGMFASHELTHVMRQMGFQPYLDFIERTPDMLNMSSAVAQVILDTVAKHRNTTLEKADPSRLYDEFNATMYGHIFSGTDAMFREGGQGAEAFYDYNEYVAELTAIHEKFKKERGRAKAKFSSSDLLKGAQRSISKNGETTKPKMHMLEDPFLADRLGITGEVEDDPIYRAYEREYRKSCKLKLEKLLGAEKVSDSLVDSYLEFAAEERRRAYIDYYKNKRWNDPPTTVGADPELAEMARFLRQRGLMSENRGFSDGKRRYSIAEESEEGAEHGTLQQGEKVKARVEKKEIEKYSKYHYNKNGTVLVTDDWTNQRSPTIPKEFKPYAVIQTKTIYRNGVQQMDRTFYDENAVMKIQIHSGPHNRPDKHPYGENGEHAHDYIWGTNGERELRSSRNLSNNEKIENADILRGNRNE